MLERALTRQATAEWLAIFERLDVPCGRVNRPHELLTDPHLQAVGLFDADFDQPTPVLRTLNQAVRFADVEAVADRPPPRLGADNAALLSELGFSPDAIAEPAGDPVVRLSP